jgi:hypothetical protein
MIDSEILLLIDSPGRRIGVPAKLYEYIGARRPILALAESDGDVAWVLRESGVPHRIAPVTDTHKIRHALHELLKEYSDRKVPASDPKASSRFTREMLTRQLVQLLEDCQT